MKIENGNENGNSSTPTKTGIILHAFINTGEDDHDQSFDPGGGGVYEQHLLLEY